MKLIEDHLSKSLKKALGKRAPVLKGPFIVSNFTGIRPEVFVHATELIDFDGIMPDGSKTTRIPAEGPGTFKGFEEDRPGRIILKITCISGSYSLLQDLCGIISPATLSSLQLLPKIPLGRLSDKSTEINFVDFTSNLHKVKLDAASDKDINFFKGEFIFYLNGFIHVWVTKKGGFRSKSVTQRILKVKKTALKKPKKPSL